MNIRAARGFLRDIAVALGLQMRRRPPAQRGGAP
jgi:hypothetical protein